MGGHNHHLGDTINAFTRSVHTKLNKNLLLRLPLAIPPAATTPSVYVSGLLHIAPIYIAFESLWQDALDYNSSSVDQSRPRFPFDYSDSNAQRPACTDERIRSLLDYLRLPELERSSNLRADIRSITGWSEDVVDVEIRLVASRMEHFISHIKRSVDRHPHVLLAYAWVLYMALFSGGRYIRGSLEDAGGKFWSKRSDPVLPTMRACQEPIISPSADEQPEEEENEDGYAAVSPTKTSAATPLQFFRFATPQDGEDLKAEFKRRLNESEARLTAGERENIVQEAICIFDHMNLLVAQLDEVFASHGSGIDVQQQANGNGNKSTAAKRTFSSSLESWARLLIPGQRSPLRDSVSVAKERKKKAQLKKDHSSGGSSSDWERRGQQQGHQEPVRRDSRQLLADASSTTTAVTGPDVGMDGLQAKGQLTSSEELIDKSAAMSSSPAGQTSAAEAESLSRSKSVRFGNNLRKPSRSRIMKRKSTAGTTGLDGEASEQDEDVDEQSDEIEMGMAPQTTRYGVDIIESPDKETDCAKMNLPWNVVLVLGLMSVLLGIAVMKSPLGVLVRV
ncbi:hypothetical protein B0H66DRAFT_599810 [Apodospora peruviana]|uniref:Heme oxygenase n=1 Tax=Apodospora peruviana TaxID=516989 RepID=A0AAE0IIM0_9PEZI|nr:hypothetical protein B0H66DRAFT_599810 [Apodospora peruviana]